MAVSGFTGACADFFLLRASMQNTDSPLSRFNERDRLCEMKNMQQCLRRFFMPLISQLLHGKRDGTHTLKREKMRFREKQTRKVS